MRKRLIISAVSAGLSALTYPLLENLADVQRGYNSSVFGGEEFVLIFGAFIVPLLILTRKRNNASADDGEVV